MADLPSVGCNLPFKVMAVIEDDLCGIKSAYGFSSVWDVGVLLSPTMSLCPFSKTPNSHLIEIASI